MAATVLAFVLKAAGTVHEIRLADTLARVMGMPYRRGFTARGLDHNAWSQIRSYVLVSVALTVAAALTRTRISPPRSAWPRLRSSPSTIPSACAIA